MRSPLLSAGLPLVALAALPLTACVDNSGGEGPPGTDVSIEAPGWDSDPQACPGAEGAWLLDDDTSVDAFLSECFDEVPGKRDALLDVVGGLDANRRFVGVRIVLGGCVHQWDFMGMKQDGAVLRPWVLKEDTSYGRANAACTDDIGWDEGFWIAQDGDVGSVTSAELWLGSFNPELPGAPALPGG